MDHDVLEDIEEETVDAASAVAEVEAILNRTLLTQLSAPFAQTYTRQGQGGKTFTYVPVKSYILRLQEVLGLNWSFKLGDTPVVGEREVSVRGTLTIHTELGPREFSAYGSARIDNGAVGNALKIAGQDALKKAASLTGVALYLSADEDSANAGYQPQGYAPPQQAAYTPPTQMPGVSVAQGQPLLCVDCGTALAPNTFRDGTSWDVQTLASRGMSKFQAVVCMTHYAARNKAFKAANPQYAS